MTANDIKRAGLIHFANEGYDGTALSTIASEVGIKKQSIYTHFANKDELFLTIMREVLHREINYLIDFMANHHTSKLDHTLFQFLNNYLNRYEQNADTKFLLRMGFLPPSHLYEQVMTSLYQYYDEFESILSDFFQSKNEALGVSIHEAVIGFIGLMDGVLIELLYSGHERFERRLQACWKIYWRGINNSKELQQDE